MRASRDDDNGDPDDDQYEEERRECRRAVWEAHELFHAEDRSGHRVFHRWMRLALRECDEIGGDDDRAQ